MNKLSEEVVEVGEVEESQLAWALGSFHTRYGLTCMFPVELRRPLNNVERNSPSYESNKLTLYPGVKTPISAFVIPGILPFT